MLGGFWLLEDSELRALRTAHAAAIRAGDRESLMAGESVSALSKKGSEATITVRGVLTPKPSRLLAFLAGNTAYSDIIDAANQARSDAGVRSVVLEVDSPGGDVDGLFEAVEAVSALRKAKSVRVRASRATSAAYALASAGGKIEAVGPAATFGSIGVAATYFMDDGVVEVTSTDSPKKRPDLRTEAGRADVRAYLDQIHALLADCIAEGRGTTTANVNAKYGRGALLLARQAKDAGMIDSIGSYGRPANTNAARAAATPPVRQGTNQMSETKKPLWQQFLDDRAETEAEERIEGSPGWRKKADGSVMFKPDDQDREAERALAASEGRAPRDWARAATAKKGV